MTDTQEPVETTNLSKKKKFRYYDSYISKVLKEVSKESGITNNAKQQLNSILITFARKIAGNALELTEISGKRTLSDKEIKRCSDFVWEIQSMQYQKEKSCSNVC